MKDGRPLEGQAILRIYLHLHIKPATNVHLQCTLHSRHHLHVLCGTAKSFGLRHIVKVFISYAKVSLKALVCHLITLSWNSCQDQVVTDITGADDAAFEAALVAMSRRNTPVLLKWNREDEHAWEPYGPASATELAAVVTPEGQITAFSAEAIGGTFRGRPRSGADLAGPAKLLANHFRSTKIGPHDGSPNMNRHGGLHRNLVQFVIFWRNTFCQKPCNDNAT